MSFEPPNLAHSSAPGELCIVHPEMSRVTRRVAGVLGVYWHCDNCGCVLSDAEARGKMPRGVVPARLRNWKHESERRRFERGTS